MLASANQNIRLDSHTLQILDTGLSGLGLQFLGSAQVRDQGDMDQNSIFVSNLMLKLSDRL